jgi:hypothetical protein
MLVGTPDAWWPSVSVAWDVNTQARHHDPRTWALAGVTLIRTTPGDLHADPGKAMGALLTAYARGAATAHRRAS